MPEDIDKSFPGHHIDMAPNGVPTGGGLNANEFGTIPQGQERGDYEAFAASRLRVEGGASYEPIIEILRNNPTREAIVDMGEQAILRYEDPNRDPDRFWLKGYTDFFEKRRIVMTIPESKLINLHKLAVYVNERDQEGKVVNGADGKPVIKTKNGERVFVMKDDFAGLAVRTDKRDVFGTKSMEEESFVIMGDDGKETPIIREFDIDLDGNKMKASSVWRRKRGEISVTQPREEIILDREDEGRVCERVESMIAVRQDFSDGYRFVYLPNTAALDRLVEGIYLNLRFTNRQLKDYWTVPDANLMNCEQAGGKENTVMGDYANLGKLMLDLIAAAETKEKMEDLLNRPALTDEVFKGYSQEDIFGTAEKPGLLETLIGKVSKNANGRLVVDWVSKENRHEGSVKEEFDAGKRGILTQWGNIFARGDFNQEDILFGRISAYLADRYANQYGHYFKEQRGFDQRSLDKTALLVGETARMLAYRWFRLSGTSARKGIEIYAKVKVGEDPQGNAITEASPEFPNPADYDYDPIKFALAIQKIIGDPKLLEKFKKSFELAGDPWTDDLTKIYHAKWYRIKEFVSKNRASGPYITIAQMTESFVVDLMSHALSDSEVEGVDVGPTDTYDEQNWGHFAEPGLGLPEIKSKRLSQMDWDIKSSIKESGYTFEEMRGDFEEAVSHLEATATKKEKEWIEKEFLSVKGIDPTQHASGSIWIRWALWQFLTARKEEVPQRTLYAIFYQKNFTEQDLIKPETYEYKNKFFNIVVSPNVICSSVYKGYRNVQRLVLGENETLRNELRAAMAGNNKDAKRSAFKKLNKAVEARLKEQQAYQVEKMKALFRLAVTNSLIYRKEALAAGGTKGLVGRTTGKAEVDYLMALYGFLGMADIYNEKLERGESLTPKEKEDREKTLAKLRQSALDDNKEAI